MLLQQTALMLVAGLIFLLFSTPGREEAHIPGPIATIFLLTAITFLPGLLSYSFGRRAIRRLSNDRDKQIIQLQNSGRYTLLFGIVALAGFVFEIYYLQLSVLVNRAFAFLKLENSRTLIGMIPLIIAILATRLGTFELDRQVRNSSCPRKAFLTMNLKLMIFPLLPFIMYLLIGDLVDHSPVSVRIFFIAHSYVYWIIMLAIVSVVYIHAPSFMRRIWVIHPLPPGEIRDRIKLLAEREDIKYRDVLVWNIPVGRIANAGIAGLLPFFRYIFLTDALLENFTADEIETIVAHEFGHAKHKHILSYLVFSFGYLVFYTLLYVHLLPVIEKLHPWSESLSTTVIAFLSAVATLFAFYTYFIFIFRSLSRTFERQADLYAVDVTGKPEVFKSALIKLSAVNHMPRRVPRFIEFIHTHPSVFRRLEFVDRATRRDANAIKYRQPIFHTGRIAVLMMLALLILFLVSKEDIFPPGDVHYEIGRQYVIEGMLDEAVREFKKAERAAPENEQIHYALGIIYARKGNMEEAIRELETALRINPENTAAREKLKQIRNEEIGL